MLKCDQPQARGGANLPLKGPQTRLALVGEPINYDHDDDDDNDNDDDFVDDDDDYDVFSSSERP